MGAEPGREPAGLPRLRRAVFQSLRKAADWLRDVGSGNTGLHWVNPCRLSSSYVGIAAGPSSRRSRKTRQLAEILADFCNRRALHTTHSLCEACLPCPFLPLSLPIENNGSELIFGQVFFLREEFAKASCSFMDDADYDEGEKITVKYSLQRKFKIFLLRIKMKLYELIES